MKWFTVLLTCVHFTFLSGALNTSEFRTFHEDLKDDVSEESQLLSSDGLCSSFFHLFSSSSSNPLPYNSGFLGIQIENTTGLPDEDVYMLMKGMGETGDQCFLNVDPASGTGKGSYAYVNPSTPSSTYSYKLSDLPGETNLRHFYVPQPFVSGRLYFSIGHPLLLAISQDTKTGKFTIPDPDGFKVTDPNYYTLYDKVEFTYNAPAALPGSNLWMNPTAVDFFSQPISIQMMSALGPHSTSGLTQARQSIFDNVQSCFNTYDLTKDKAWNKLILPFLEDPFHSKSKVLTPLRISSPGKSLAANSNPAQVFPVDYLANSSLYGFNYVENLWNFYKANTLRINAQEIASKWGPGTDPQFADHYHFTGNVQGDTFVFTNDSKDFTWKMTKPEPNVSSSPFFAGAGFVDDGEANNTPGAVIVRQITSAFDVGLLPEDFKEGCFMDGAYFQAHKSNYYAPRPEWGHNGPFYDLYSKALHSIGEPIYTFAYDDALGQDGTLTGNVEASKSYPVITLHKIDTPLPDPYNDPNQYTVMFAVAASNPVQYRIGKTGPWAPAQSNVNIPNVTSNQTDPLQMMIKNSQTGKQDILTLYLKYQIVVPSGTDFSAALGVKISQTSPTSFTIATPG